MTVELAGGAQVPPPRFATVIPLPLAQAPERGAFDARRRPRGSSSARRPPRRAVWPSCSPRASVRRRGTASPCRPYAPALPTASIALALTPGDRALGGEGYRLVVARGGVTLTAARPAGLFWGTQTLRQLLPAAIEADARQPGPWRISLGTIHDRPRFGWRGAMLDVARHFFGVGEVKRLIDLMALYKLNRLHLHLSDDQGWRIAIRSWPRLTSHGVAHRRSAAGRAAASRSASTLRSSPTPATASSRSCRRSTCPAT